MGVPVVVPPITAITSRRSPRTAQSRTITLPPLVPVGCGCVSVRGEGCVLFGLAQVPVPGPRSQVWPRGIVIVVPVRGGFESSVVVCAAGSRKQQWQEKRDKFSYHYRRVKSSERTNNMPGARVRYECGPFYRTRWENNANVQYACHSK